MYGGTLVSGYCITVHTHSVSHETILLALACRSVVCETHLADVGTQISRVSVQHMIGCDVRSLSWNNA